VMLQTRSASARLRCACCIKSVVSLASSGGQGSWPSIILVLSIAGMASVKSLLTQIATLFLVFATAYASSSIGIRWTRTWRIGLDLIMSVVSLGPSTASSIAIWRLPYLTVICCATNASSSRSARVACVDGCGGRMSEARIAFRTLNSLHIISPVQGI